MRTAAGLWVVVVVMAVVAGLSCAADETTEATAQSEAKVIRNPVADRAADPWVIRREGWYYYCYADRGGIRVHRSERLEEALERGGGVDLAAGARAGVVARGLLLELHRLAGKWWVYSQPMTGGTRRIGCMCSSPHRRRAEKSIRFSGAGEDATGPVGDRRDGAQCKGKLYFLWSGWEGDENVVQNLYIAPMASPTEISGERVLISRPEYAWEKVDRPLVNEGPEVLKHGERVFVVYSASGSWADHYCLGQLELAGEDLLKAESWVKKAEPVFAGTEGVISPGHASFTVDAAGQDWIVYHAARRPGAGWDRVGCMQPFGWTAEGEPDFGRPVAWGEAIASRGRSRGWRCRGASGVSTRA